MKAEEIYDLLNKSGINCNGIVVDDVYSLPTKKWFLSDNARALDRNLKTLGASVYIKNKNDCDDFSIIGAVLARLAHNVSTNKESGLAVGFLCYMTDSGQGHAIQFAIVNEKGRREIVFFEPQTKTETKLSASELTSVFFFYV